MCVSGGDGVNNIMICDVYLGWDVLGGNGVDDIMICDVYPPGVFLVVMV